MTQLENVRSQISHLRNKWTELAGKGNHAEAVGVENEIEALERAEVRHQVQQETERNEKARARAVGAATATLAEIETHRAARADLEAVIAEIEAATKGVDAAFARVEAAWSRALATRPRKETFKDPAQQQAYDEALGAAGRYPDYSPLRLQLRLPAVLEVLHTRDRVLHVIFDAANLL